MRQDSEGTRRWVHALFGCAAFSLPFLDWRAAFFVALFALFVNAEILPRTTVGRRLFRPGEGWTGGVILYPFTVAVLILIYRSSSLPAAVAWSVLAFGDPAAAWAGNRFEGPRLPWNTAKTVVGSLVFFVCAFPVAALCTLQYDVELWRAVLVAATASGAGAAAESVAWRIDDNLAVGLTASLAAALTGGLL